MTYTEYISQFEVFDNPPIREGFHRHHIVPQQEQEKLYGQVIDTRQVYVSYAQHLWAHILYDQENGTNTSQFLVSITKKSKEYFDCFEKCLAYSYTFNKMNQRRSQSISEIMKQTGGPWKGKHLSEEHRQNVSNSLKGREFSEEHRKHLSEASSGRVMSEEAKKKISEWNREHSTVGDIWRGKHLTDEAKRKISESKKGKIPWNKGKKGLQTAWNKGLSTKKT